MWNLFRGGGGGGGGRENNGTGSVTLEGMGSTAGFPLALSDDGGNMISHWCSGPLHGWNARSSMIVSSNK